MHTKHLLSIAVMTTLTLAYLPTASAADILVRCEKRGDSRSRVSVDGGDLVPGEYRARIISGDNRRTSLAQTPVGGEVEFDFDSRLADINAGATSIPASFIQNGQVTGKILNSRGRTVISDTVRCRVR